MRLRDVSWLLLCARVALADLPPPPTPASVQTVVFDKKVLVANAEAEGESDGRPGFAVSPDGQKIALFNRQAHRVRINDTSGTKSLLTLENRDPKEFAWSPDSSTLVLKEIFFDKQPRARIIFARLNDKTIKETVCDGFSSRLLVLSDGRALVHQLTSLWLVSPDGVTPLLQHSVRNAVVSKQTVFFTDAQALFTFELSKPSEVRTLATFDERGTGYGLFAPDAQTVYANGLRGSVLRIKAGEKRSFEVPATLGLIKGLEASPDGKFLAAWGDHRTAVLELSSGKVTFEAKIIRRPRWLRDSSALFVFTSEALLKVPVTTWEPTRVAPGHAGIVIDADVLGSTGVFELEELPN